MLACSYACEVPSKGAQVHKLDYVSQDYLTKASNSSLQNRHNMSKGLATLLQTAKIKFILPIAHLAAQCGNLDNTL